MWQYGQRKLKDIGTRGVFAGWSLSLLKDSFGYAAFFSTFEYIKAQAYYDFIAKYYGQWELRSEHPVLRPRIDDLHSGSVIRPHYSIEPVFLMLAGIAASVTQQIVQHPISLVQGVHHKSVLALENKVQYEQFRSQSRRNYRVSYGKTYEHCLTFAREYQGWRRWLYRGFFWSTIRQMPSTSAGLIIFELVRRRFGTDTEAVLISQGGYDILVT